MKKILKIIENIFTILIICLILVVSVYIVQIKIMNKKYANICGYTFFEVVTGSMANTINIGDVVIVKLNSEYAQNDIVVYESNTNYITHRIIEINQNGIVTKGDNNNTEDEIISKEQILGKVISIIPNVGLIKKIILEPSIILALISIVVICIILSKIKEDKKKEE